MRLGGVACWVGGEGDEARGWDMLGRGRGRMRLGGGAC